MLNSYSKHLPQMTEIYDVIGIYDHFRGYIFGFYEWLAA